MSIFKKNRKVKNEVELIDLAKKDSRYFTPIYNKYYEPIFRFIYQRMDEKEAAADIVSQVFLKALVNINKYEHKGFPFSSWLYRIATNEINQYYRNNKKGRTVNLDENDIKVVIEEVELPFNIEKRDLLIATLASLKQEKIELIEMRFFEKRSFKEMGSILNITENNAKVKTYRVLEEMKKIML